MTFLLQSELGHAYNITWRYDCLSIVNKSEFPINFGRYIQYFRVKKKLQIKSISSNLKQYHYLSRLKVT